jgi:hypothetical protein
LKFKFKPGDKIRYLSRECWQGVNKGDIITVRCVGKFEGECYGFHEVGRNHTAVGSDSNYENAWNTTFVESNFEFVEKSKAFSVYDELEIL